MREIWRHLKGYRFESVLAPLLKCLEAIFELLVPLVVADIIDGAVIGGDRSVLTRGFLFLLLFGFVGFGVAALAQFFSAKAAVGVSHALKRDLFEHIGKLSYTQLDGLGTSTLITRMTSDVALVQNGVNLFLRLFLRSPFIVFGAVVMAWRLSGSAGVLIFAIVTLLFASVFAVMGVSTPMNRKVQEKSDSVLRKTRENVTGVKGGPGVRTGKRRDERIPRDVRPVLQTAIGGRQGDVSARTVHLRGRERRRDPADKNRQYQDKRRNDDDWRTRCSL